MNVLVVPAVVLTTVLVAVSLGIAAAYGVVIGILQAFAAQARQEPVLPAVLVPSQTHVGAD